MLNEERTSRIHGQDPTASPILAATTSPHGNRHPQRGRIPEHEKASSGGNRRHCSIIRRFQPGSVGGRITHPGDQTRLQPKRDGHDILTVTEVHTPSVPDEVAIRPEKPRLSTQAAAASIPGVET
jgi:hypothetical protein